MTGGTSLAVWMGGVTHELFSVLRADPERTRPVDGVDVYTRLLAATHTAPVVDVVTGTSAGGLNGMLLAVAVHLGLTLEDFDKVRDTWMKDGDFASLLRSPGESDPPSLLQGDAHFQARIEDVLEQWWSAGTKGDHGPAGGEDCQVDLLTTYTSVNPTPVARFDDFDEGLNEVNYAGTLRFDHKQLNQDQVRTKLAIAARVSAGIPGVFEPCFLPSNYVDAKASGRPNFAEHQPAEIRGLSRWAVDGGVVVNLPLRYVVDRIFEQRSAGRVRRVVLYVSPTPSDALAPEPDAPAKRPKLAASAITAVNAPRAEGIASDVDAIRRSNEAVERQRQARRTLGLLFGAASAENLNELYVAYKVTRSASSVDKVVASLRPRFHDDERFAEREFRAALMKKRPNLLPETIEEFAGGGEAWGWGIATIEQTASAVLGLINQALENLAAQRTPEDSKETEEQLGQYKTRVHDQLAKLAQLRRQDDQFWIAFITSIKFSGSDPPDVKSRKRQAHYATAYEKWPSANNPSPEKRREVFEDLRKAHRETVRVLLQATPRLRTLAATPPADATNAEDGAVSTIDGPANASVSDLTAELRACVGEGEVGGGNDGDAPQETTEELLLDEIERRMLRFHVVATQAIGGLRSREQSVELMQISSNAQNELDPARTSADKLVGPEFGRLGAFLKESWRANDWLWGRMDGAARLCQLLVDPRRIWELYSRNEVDAALDAFAITSEHPSYDAIKAEMASLLGRSDPSECKLPKLVAALTRERQLAIARVEIPLVHDAIGRSEAVGGNEVRSRAFAEAARSVDDHAPDRMVEHALKKLEIGRETAATEFGSRLMVRNLTRALTVATNAVTGRESGLKAVSGPLRVMRAPLRFMTAIIGTLTGASPLARALTAMILAGAGAILALRLAGVEVSGVLSGAAAALFVGALATALVRIDLWRFSLLFLPLAALFVMAMVGDDLREVFYDKIEVTRVEVGPAVTIIFGAETTVEVRKPGSHGGSEMLSVDDAMLVTLLADATSVATATETVSHRWKGIFLADSRPAPFTWIALAVSLSSLAAVGIRCWCARRRVNRNVDPDGGRGWACCRRNAIWLGVASGAAVLGIANYLAGEELLTGSEADGGPKAWMVSVAEGLAAQQLVVFLVMLVVLGTVIGLGTSGVSRAWRGGRVR